MHTLALFALVALGAVELALCAWMLRNVRRQRDLARRVGALADALSLLAETSEAGFRAGAVEVARLADHLAARRTKAPHASHA